MNARLYSLSFRPVFVCMVCFVAAIRGEVCREYSATRCPRDARRIVDSREYTDEELSPLRVRDGILGCMMHICDIMQPDMSSPFVSSRDRQATALMRAAAKGNCKAMTHHLLKAEMKKQDVHGYTALMWAVAHNQLESAKLLIKKEGGMRDKRGRTALMIAAEYGYTNCVRLLLDKEAGQFDYEGATALMFAAENGHLDCVRLLIDFEWDKQCKNCATALMFAAMSNQKECVELLITKEVGIHKNRCEEALTLAAKYGSNECVQILSQYVHLNDAWYEKIGKALRCAARM